ncbi:MAG: TIR domain-containing protein [Phormidesmis sp.]
MIINIFFSFSEKDDRSGDLTYFSRVLANEMQLLLREQPEEFYGHRFHLSTELYESLDSAELLVVFLSPNFFDSEQCKAEVRHFLNRADLANPLDHVIPIYYSECGLLGSQLHSEYPFAKQLSENCIDWRRYRSVDLTEQTVRETISLIAQQTVTKLDFSIKRKRISQSASDIGRIEEVVGEIELILSEIQARVASAKERSVFRRLFHVEVVRRVLKAAQEEIQQLTGPTNEYRQNLSLQESFVVRAGAIFEEASKAYAISVDRYSEFWVDERQRSKAQRYTERQPDNTKRLFVFSSVESAHQYRNVMSAHNRHYGKDGAVFFCSQKKYHDFLLNSFSKESLSKNKLHERDFGILVFNDDIGEELYLATLSRTTLECQKLIRPLKYQTELMNHFDHLKEHLVSGAMHETGIVKWSDEFTENDSIWGRMLKSVFDIDEAEEQSILHGSVHHLVFLSKSVNGSELEKLVNNVLRPKLLALKHMSSAEPLLEDLWFGTRSQVVETLSVVDGRHQGALKTNNEFIENFPHCLIMKLRDIESLKAYYEDTTHSEVRQEVYQLYDQEISNLYDILTSNEELSEDQRSSLYSAVEERANRIIIRADYTQENYVKYIVKTPSPPFDVH